MNRKWEWLRMLHFWGSVAPDLEEEEERKLKEIEDARIRVRLLDLKAELILAQQGGKSK